MNSIIKEKIKRYSNYRFDAKSYLLHHYVKDEKAVIPIHVTSIDDLFCSYSKNKVELNPELVSYIEDVTYYIPYEYSIEFELDGTLFSDDEKAMITASLKDYFGMLAYDKKVELKYNTKKAITLFTTGIIVLCISFLMSGGYGIGFLKEVLSIIGTFAIWEFVDTIWFDRSSKKIDVLNAGQVAVATIDFVEDELDKD